jgi:hypothetical protein
MHNAARAVDKPAIHSSITGMAKEARSLCNATARSTIQLAQK